MASPPPRAEADAGRREPPPAPAARDPRRLTAEQFEHVVSHLRSDRASGVAHNRRRAPRVGVRTTVTVVPYVAGGAAVRRDVRVRDLSPGGIGLLYREPLPAGTILACLLQRANGDAVNAVYRVVRCTRVGDGQYAVGAKLDRVVDAAALRPEAA